MQYNQKCLIYRKVNGKAPPLNRPTATTETLGPFPCSTALPGKNRHKYEQGTPQADVSIDLVLYAPANINLKAGDIVCLPVAIDPVTKEVILTGSEKYVASLPYKPGNHHAECNLSLQRSV